MKRMCLLATVLLSLTACAFDLPLAKKTPVVDGVLSPGEWDEGVTLAGFLSHVPTLHLAPGNDGTATFLSDGKTLFVAFHVKAHNIDIGGGLKATADRRDGPVYDDDAVELAVEGDEAGSVAHFIINSKDVVFDRLAKPGVTAADVAWDCEGLKVCGRVLNGWWDLEVSIPLQSIGAFSAGFSVNAARSTPGEVAASLTASDDYIHGPKLRFDWKRNASAVQVVSLGVPTAGEWRPTVAFTSGAADARVRVDVLLRETNDNGKDGTVLLSESQVIRVGERFSPSYDTRSRKLLHAEITARDAATGEMLVDRSFYAQRGARSSGVPPTAEFDLGDIGEVCAYVYPGMGKARFTFHSVPGAEVRQVQVRVGARTASLKSEGSSFTGLVEIPSANGMHPVAFAVRTASGVRRFDAAWTLERRTFEWEGNSIGKEKVILPPFKPIVAKGAALGVILRTYVFGTAGLPKELVALGRNILAEGGAYYEMSLDGKSSRFTGANPRFTIKDSGYSAEVVSEAQSADVTLTTKGNFEYDGFLWNEVALSGLGARTLDRLTLVVPFKDAEAPLMHICTTDSIRFNPTGAVPTGEGVVWDGTKLYRNTGFAEKMFAEQAVPYVWLGAEKRGLSWFINNTAGLRIATDRPSVRLVREKGVLRLEVDLVNVPSRLADGHRFAFGFEATPVKEADKSMRRHFQTGTGYSPKGMIPRPQLSGGFWNSWARRPYNNDWGFFEAMLKRANSGKYRQEYIDAYAANTNRYDRELEAYAAKLPVMGNETHYQWMKSCRDYQMSTLLSCDRPTYPFKYSDPTLNWTEEESVPFYKSEWISRSTGYMGATRNFLTPSYIDYCLFYYKKWQDLGMKGMYFDDMFPMVCRNPDTCMEKDGAGVWHGNFGILEMRELVKRAAVMQYLGGVSPRMIQIHMTNCLLVPSFAFGTSMLSWEDHFGNEVFQKRFPLDYMRAESLGSQIGAESVALDGIRQDGWDDKDWRKNRFRFLTRTQQALLLPAGVKTWMRPWVPFGGVDREELFKILEVLSAFEIWTDDCEFKAFYENDGAIRGAPKDVLVGSYRKPGKALVILGDAGGKDLDLALSADAARLGLSEPLAFTDAETGKPLENGRVKLPAWDLRLVLVTERDAPR